MQYASFIELVARLAEIKFRNPPKPEVGMSLSLFSGFVSAHSHLPLQSWLPRSAPLGARRSRPLLCRLFPWSALGCASLCAAHCPHYRRARPFSHQVERLDKMFTLLAAKTPFLERMGGSPSGEFKEAKRA